MADLSFTLKDVNALPTVHADDKRVRALAASLDDLAEEHDAAQEALPGAVKKAREARETADELEVEVYASEDVTEADVEAAQQKAQEAEERVETLKATQAQVSEAIDRVRGRLNDERKEAGVRLSDAYAPALLKASRQAAEALRAARDALEVMNAARRKAKANNVGGSRAGWPVGKEFSGRPFNARNRRVRPDVEAIMEAAIGVAEAPIEPLDTAASEPA